MSGQGSGLVIDTQHHWFGSGYRAALAAEAARNPAFAAGNALVLGLGDEHPAVRLDERLELMDEAGIDVSVLSVAPPAARFGTARAAAETAAIANDEIVAACARRPDRLVGLAILPLPFVEESVAELDRLADQPVIRGTLVGVDALSYAPDKLLLAPVLERLERAGLALVVHPAGHEPGPNRSFEDFSLAASFEAMLWTSLVALRFILSGLLDHHPMLDLVVPHLGGVLPYLTQRLVDQASGEAERELPHYLRHRLYFDSCSFHRPALRCAAETVGAARIMLGSDFPFRGELGRCVADVRDAGFLSPEDRRAMLGGTAARWFAPPG